MLLEQSIWRIVGATAPEGLHIQHVYAACKALKIEPLEEDGAQAGMDETVDKMLYMSIGEPTLQKALVEVEPDKEEKELIQLEQ